MPSYLDPVNELTIGELDAGSRLLKTDLVDAVSNATMHKWAGLAIVAYLHARRTDPTARVETFRAMTPLELVDALGLSDLLGDAPAADLDDQVDDEDVDQVAAPGEPRCDVPTTIPTGGKGPAVTAACVLLAGHIGPHRTDPTFNSPAADAVARVEAAVAASPTVPTPAPSSPGRGGVTPSP